MRRKLGYAERLRILDYQIVDSLFTNSIVHDSSAFDWTEHGPLG